MVGEAKKFGISVEVAKMSALPEMPVFLLGAKYGSGYPEALQAITKALRYPTPGMTEKLRSHLEQDEHIETEMACMLKHTVPVPARLSDNLTEKLDSVMLQTGIAELFTWLRERRLVPLTGRPAASLARFAVGRHLQGRDHRRHIAKRI